ncbi:hypothetical protein O6H91_13G023700 [Diphasiastrum complanatum]|uniref:Uncharacterized protein n=1 Tax=Diphasiastrum complanatum TaxID=34168 RepID=A0ACC2BSY5_DIPCM|nr:hypothetical protein O6H91_13G023700 [Diphasiastrum complanatum]
MMEAVTPASWFSDCSMEDIAVKRTVNGLSTAAVQQLASHGGCSGNEDHNLIPPITSSQKQQVWTSSADTPCSINQERFPTYERPYKLLKSDLNEAVLTQHLQGRITTPKPRQFIGDLQPLQPQYQYQPQQLEYGGCSTFFPRFHESHEFASSQFPPSESKRSPCYGGPESCVSEFGMTEAPYSSLEKEFTSNNSLEWKTKLELLSMHSSSPKLLAASVKSSSQSVDHIMAERKRREKLTQKFVTLSSIVPGLKKLDKASVLGDTIKYVKQLQERLKMLEEQAQEAHSVAICKKVVLTDVKEPPQHGAASESSVDQSSIDHVRLPEIEARMLGHYVLIKVHCKKQKGLLGSCLAELEKLHLHVCNASLLSFSDANFDLTINAQVNRYSEVSRHIGHFLRALQ